jgi:hypothetical protein
MRHLRLQGVSVDEGQYWIPLITVRISRSTPCRYFAQQSGYTPQIIVHGDGSQCTGQTCGATWRNKWSVDLSRILSQDSSKLIEDLLSKWGVSGVVARYPLLYVLAQLSEQRAARKRVWAGPLGEQMWDLTYIPGLLRFRSLCRELLNAVGYRNVRQQPEGRTTSSGRASHQKVQWDQIDRTCNIIPAVLARM